MQPNKRTDAATERAVLASLSRGLSNRTVAEDFGLDEATVRRIKSRATSNVPSPVKSQIVFDNKKVGEFSWRAAIPAMKQMQELRKTASWGQQEATIRIPEGDVIGLMQFGDQHIGAMGADYSLFLELTDIILNTPNLYVALMGDEVEMAIKLRGVAEVCAQVLDPSMQAAFIESWIEEIAPKVLFSVWSNHSTEREEAATGNSIIKSILARKVVFFSGLGHVDLYVGEQLYKLAVTHKFKGATAMDPTAGCKKYMRFNYPEADVAMQGDIHQPKIEVIHDGGKQRVAATSGTLHIASGFAQRYFSLKTSTAFPVIAFWREKKQVVPFFTIEQYLDCLG